MNPSGDSRERTPHPQPFRFEHPGDRGHVGHQENLFRHPGVILLMIMLILFFGILLPTYLLRQAIQTDLKVPTTIRNYSSLSFQPWENHPYCSDFQVYFAKQGTFQPQALVSLPGSGHKWLRNLIEQGTGFFTGLINDNYTIKVIVDGQLLKAEEGETIVQKIHHELLYSTFNESTSIDATVYGYRGILLIGDPYDAMLSFWKWSKEQNRGPQISGREWTKFVARLIPQWTQTVKRWVEKSPRKGLLILDFEKVKKNPREELEKIIKFLGRPVEKRRVGCLFKPENLDDAFDPTPTKEMPFSSPFRYRYAKNIDLNKIMVDNINELNNFFAEKRIPIILKNRQIRSTSTSQ